jgi:uncharacterized protein YndB with AHSA1/START domain
MSEDDFVIETNFAATPESLYQALATREGIAGWWTKFTSFDDRLGSIAEMRFPEAGFYAKFKVLVLTPSKLVQWECLDSMHPEKSGFADLAEWNGTKVRFEITPRDGERCKLTFTHEGLVPRLECNETCRSIWSFYIGTSLRGLLEKGRGEPYGA